MLGRRHNKVPTGSGDVAPAQDIQEVRPATAEEIGDASLIVSAAWHGLRSGTVHLPEGFAPSFQGDEVRVRSTPDSSLPLNYSELVLRLNEGDSTSWTAGYVVVTPNYTANEVNEGFRRRVTEFPLSTDGDCTQETAIVKPSGPDNRLEPIEGFEPPTVEHMGPITTQQLAGVTGTLRQIGITYSPSQAA